jgi:hypothetical protein
MRLILPVLAVLALGCPGPSPSTDMPPGQDGAATPDMPAPAEDLRSADLRGADLRGADLRIEDLRMNDLRMNDLRVDPDLRPPMLDPRPMCPGANVNATTVYNQVIAPKCSGGGFCHVGGGMAAGLAMGNSPTDFRNAVVNKKSFSAFNYVTPGDIHKSYILYKILGLQNLVEGGGGGQMPSGDTLTDAQKCLLIDWVAAGAN